jgi:hypothetical protein
MAACVLPSVVMQTVIGMLKDTHEARAALHDLEKAGFTDSELSLLSHGGQGGDAEPLSDAAKGAAAGGLSGLLLGIAALAIPGIGPILAAGPIAVALAGASVGAAAGGIIGALTNIDVPEQEAKYYEEALRRGGSLVVVRSAGGRVEEAQDVLDRHGAVDLDERAAQEGWDVNAAHSNPDNFGDEGGSSQWGRSMLSSSADRLRSRMYARTHPDNRPKE